MKHSLASDDAFGLYSGKHWVWISGGIKAVQTEDLSGPTPLLCCCSVDVEDCSMYQYMMPFIGTVVIPGMIKPLPLFAKFTVTPGGETHFRLLMGFLNTN